MNDYTFARLRQSDTGRIKKFISIFESNPDAGNFYAHHIIKLALDALDEKINKKNGISTVQAEEIPKN